MDEIKKVIDGKGVDYIVDFVGGDYFNKNLDVVVCDVWIVFFGIMGGKVVL